jgi:D-glycero-alpha-D-manno-heptose 1-phosphate guanylyltransferase
MAAAFEAIVLAGGLGTRLRSAVPDCPKPLAPVAGRPFLDYLLGHLEHVGARHLILSIGYLGEQIEARYGDRFGSATISYSREAAPLGTGGALRQALACSTGAYTLALNGDTLLECDPWPFIVATARANKQLGIITREVSDTQRYGRCELSNEVVVGFGQTERAGPGLINAGVYCLRHDLFEGHDLPDRFSFEHDFIAPQLARLKPYGTCVRGYFIDIGVPDDFDRAQRELPLLRW